MNTKNRNLNNIRVNLFRLYAKCIYQFCLTNRCRWEWWMGGLTYCHLSSPWQKCQMANAFACYCSCSISFQVIHPHWLLWLSRIYQHHCSTATNSTMSHPQQRKITNKRWTRIQTHTPQLLPWTELKLSISNRANRLPIAKYGKKHEQSHNIFSDINLCFTTYLLIMAYKFRVFYKADEHERNWFHFLMFAYKYIASDE